MFFITIVDKPVHYNRRVQWNITSRQQFSFKSNLNEPRLLAVLASTDC